LRIEKLRLTNFRNFAEATVMFGPRRNLILGANAQGKTNILEAIHILGVGRSHREPRDANLMRFGEAYYRIEGTFEHIGVRTTIEIACGDEGKRIRINGKEARPSELVGLSGVVISSPDDMDLVKGAPSFRRRFLDIAISQMSLEYLKGLQQYVKVLSQRNMLLKSSQLRGAGPVDTGPWDAGLVRWGASVVAARLEFLQELATPVQANFNAIAGAESRLALDYDPRGYEAEAGDDITCLLREALRSTKEAECARGYTLVGPHTDDIRILADGRDLRRFGSEGESRTAVLALRCAEVTAIERKTGRFPIVLLDDVFAELDDARTQALTALITGYDQIILASSRRPPRGAGEVTLIKVENGRVDQDDQTREGR
jgi:DNA replication and repair protein RecF